MPLEVQTKIEDLAGRGFGAKQIHDYVWDAPELARFHPPQRKADLPALRTVQRMVQALRQPPPEGAEGFEGAEGAVSQLAPWRMQNATPEEAAAVLPVLAAVIKQTEGRTDYLTLLEARWAVRIAAVAPDLSPWWIAWLANKCAVREIRGGTTYDATSPYDKVLALAPWRSDAAFEEFAKFVCSVHREWLPGRQREVIEGAVLDACRIRAEQTGREVMEVVADLMKRLGDKEATDGDKAS